MTFRKWLCALLAAIMLCTMMPVALMEEATEAHLPKKVLWKFRS